MFERVDNSVANSIFILVSAHTSNKIAVYKDIYYVIIHLTFKLNVK